MSSRMLWYIRRLRAMSIREIGYRFQQRAIAEWERFRRTARQMPSSETLSRAWTEFRTERGVRFFFQWDRKGEIVQQYNKWFPSNGSATLQTASELLEHKFQIFGRKFVLGSPIPWHADPLTGLQWPISHWIDIDIRLADAVGGIKWVWELNRHHHLVTLGKAYFLSGEERFAEEVCSQLEDWIVTNPPYIGVNWTSSLELALRLINWAFTLAFIRQAPALREDLFALVMQSIITQADYISRHLSAYSSANNHLIGEAAGLAVIGLTFPWLPRARFWRDKGLSILTQEIEKQLFPDGVPCEQSTHYLAFVLDFNLLAWRLAELNGFSVPAVWYERLSAACDFIQHLMDEQGNMPAIGDGDDSWVVRLDDRAEANNYQSILATASVLLRRPDLKIGAGQWDEKSYWLLGEEGRGIFETLPRINVNEKIRSRAFRVGGYCVMRNSDRVIVFDCGPLGYLSTAAHGHADALSIIVSVRGKPLLVDPGTYAYHEGGQQRDYFRSTAAHNTVVVDGRNQSEMLGTFLWGRKAEARLLRWEPGTEYDLAVAEHNGYKRQGVIHRRTVFYYKPDWLIVIDDLLGKGEHILEQLWHLSPAYRFDSRPERCVAFIEADDGLFPLFIIELPAGFRTKVYLGVKNPMQGWFSRWYGQIEPAPVLSISACSTLPVRLSIALCLRNISAIDESSLNNLRARATELLRFLAGGL